MTNADILKKGIEDLGLKCSDETIDKFSKYREILVEWNQKMNLTGIEEEKEVYIKHFLDSVAAVKKGYIKDGMSIIDVGTGAGFPGLPLRICLENSKVTLLDSLNKRINFLSEVCTNINIDDIELIHGRAEDFGKDEKYREQYDIATARAVAGLPILMEFCVPFIKVGGYFVCLKGPNADTELEESRKAMEVLGLEFVEKIDVELPEIELKHNIVVFKKVNSTPAKYPRKAGKPVKTPIK
ncbi:MULTISPECIES: 16S rRNA (guanine(527)-N(7))-methyltransferase RsmG [Paraclostridium]|jgi:16S rRNA (guanine527-N7)-methyltransferase|uniref:Ribosomal RNA small subunit methyltransferase G n=3 Tax=Peptostreptococcaceae TaxID=186804 RepID=A0A5P3XK70_PARBF|nr:MULTISPECIES: 16S rRNA (guanine(527)-N(7))-methyltransferase RsmG [Paraclostridium]MDV8113952.1 16S rRNA (guanine(527)-N(7))-methyltransferase RsmG [Bacillus sp. BAU-SS-2023]EQK40580.1 ribosomal RNA small subunit methyltransferase G [[Clostridium] bifermentans ATCC 638] [Paraclostridium bifermentans ATCC 638 = DSM 14991]EQK49554.1 ribosomal RNA small subunit methyltransferase G [[Clostridium] bifermentans ATCC 19299] [Paraclostridium bifermentans ATCC 19299]MBN8048715.1 16S rRNA (guanine(527